MRFIALTCPGCGYRFTVSSNAPAMVTCPNCLTSMANPSKGAEIEPVPVIPVEQASSSDRKIAASLLALLGILVFAGAIAMLRSTTISFSGVLAIIASFSVLASAVLFSRKSGVRPNAGEGPVLRRGSSLEYEPRAPQQGPTPSKLAIGFGVIFLVLLIIFGILFLLFGACAISIFKDGF